MGGAAQPTLAIIGTSPAAAAWIARLADAGYAVEREPFTGPDDLRRLARRPPRAVVIDLDRAPSTRTGRGLRSCGELGGRRERERDPRARVPAG